MTAVLALLLGCTLWIVGLRICRERSVDRREFEYWWAFGAFFSGGLGTLAQLLLPTLSGDQVTAFKTASLAILGLALVARTLLSRDAFIPPAAFALLVCFAIMFTGEGVAMPMASFLTFLPALIVPAAGYNFNALRAGAASGISFLLVFLVGITFLQPNQLIAGCTGAYKCSYWGAKLGLGATGNALGLYLAAASAVTFLAATTWYKFLLPSIGSLICVELTVSRSGLAAWAVAVGIWMAYMLSRRFRNRAPVILATSAVWATAAAIPFLEWSASEVTFRPVLWWQAATLFERSPFFGYGASYWVRDNSGFPTGSDFALQTNYSTHNILMEMLVSAGALGALAFFLSLILASTSSRHGFELSIHTIALIGIIVGLSFTEVTSAPGRIYLYPGILIYLFLTASAGTVDPFRKPSVTTTGFVRGDPTRQHSVRVA